LSNVVDLLQRSWNHSIDDMQNVAIVSHKSLKTYSPRFTGRISWSHFSAARRKHIVWATIKQLISIQIESCNNKQHNPHYLSENIHRLQRMHKALQRVVLGSSASKFSHSTDMLCHLHWLPVQYRIQFKLALLAFNARNNNAPLYLSCLLHNYVPGRSLRSSQSNLLCVPSYKLNFVTRSFWVAAPTVWNSLPADIRACTFYGSSNRHLKAFYFNNAF